jgi:hypothetical protein
VIFELPDAHADDREPQPAASRRSLDFGLLFGD